MTSGDPERSSSDLNTLTVQYRDSRKQLDMLFSNNR